jgi:RNA polymerase sigma factor (sigma-70 family)
MKDKVAKYYETEMDDLLRRTRTKVDNPSDADDIVSEAAITVLRQVTTGKLTKEEDIGRFFTVALNSRSIDARRKADAYGRIDQELESGLTLDQQFSPAPNPEEQLEADQESLSIAEWIDKERNAKCRKILTKVYLHEMKVSDVAAELSLSKQYVRRVVAGFTCM